jgi:AraC-like DNA-binding protein
MVRLDEGGHAAIEARLLAPGAALAPWVQHVSIQPGPARHAAPGRPWRVVPDTSAHLVFSVARDRPSCRLVGARSIYADVDVSGRTRTVALRLQPGALPALLRDSATGLTDRALDVSDVFGADGRRLLDALAEATPVGAAFLLFEFVRRRCRSAIPPAEAVALRNVVRVSQVQHRLGLSARAAHRRVVDRVGLSPKRALRIARLLAALEAARLDPRAALCRVAADAGFSDQAHFTREARALLGEPPAAWFARGADSFKTQPHAAR